jgi:hypothetical protein
VATLFEMRVWELNGSVIAFQTADAASGSIGFRIRDFMGLNQNSPIWFYEQLSLNGATPIVTLVKKGATTFATRLPAEPEQLNIPEATLKIFRRDFIANFMPEHVDDTGETLSVSPETLKFIDDLLAQRAVRQAFYSDDRLALLTRRGLKDEEIKLLLAIQADPLEAFCAKVDLIMADDRHRDDGNYVLFDVNDHYDLPDPAWIRAARPYLSHFRANFGHYTTDARVYERVLVVAHTSRAAAMQRTLTFLNRHGADAQLLTADDASGLKRKLNQLVKANYPLPERGGRYDYAPSSDQTQQTAN